MGNLPIGSGIPERLVVLDQYSKSEAIFRVES
jgi:hypothetical protein